MSGNAENLRKEDKEKMKTFLSALYKQVPVFAGDPNDLENFLSCIRKIETPALEKTIFEMVKTKLQGPAVGVVKNSNCQDLKELKDLLKSNFKSPTTEPKNSKPPRTRSSQDSKTPKAESSKNSDGIAEKSIQPAKVKVEPTEESQNNPSTSNQKSSKKMASSDDKNSKGPKSELEKQQESNSSDDKSKSSKEIRDVPKSERKEEILKILKNKKLMALIDEARRKNMRDSSTQTDATTEVQTNVKNTKDQTTQTVRGNINIIKNYVTINLHHPTGDIPTEEIRKEIIENLDRSLLKKDEAQELGNENGRKSNDSVSETDEQINEMTVEADSPETNTAEEIAPAIDLNSEPVEKSSIPSSENEEKEETEKSISEPEAREPESLRKELAKESPIPSSEDQEEAEEGKTDETIPELMKTIIPDPMTPQRKPTRERSIPSRTSERKRRSGESSRSKSDSKRFKSENKPLSRSPRSNRHSGGTRNQYCSFCRKGGHSLEDCRCIKRYCEYCQKNGHLVSECRKKAYHNLNGISLPANWNYSQVQGMDWTSLLDNLQGFIHKASN